MEKLFVKAEIERTDKGMVAVASTAVEDRHGEVVTVEGWDIKNFKKNPVLLWAHNHDEPAIGYAKNLKKDMTFEPVFHDKTPLAKAIKSLYEGDDQTPPILNSFSVGFRALDMDGNKYTSQELLEISAVNVPANPQARVMAYKSLKAKGFDDEVIAEVGGQPETVTVSKDELEALKRDNQVLKSQMDTVVKGLKHLNPQGRKSEVVTERLALSKVIARANDKLLEKKPAGESAKLLKVIKRANEKLIVDHKQELKNGKN